MTNKSANSDPKSANSDPASEQSDVVALETFRTYITVMAETFQDDDFEAYAAGVALPFMVKTDGETMMVHDLDTLRQGFDAWTKMVQRNGINSTKHKIINAAWVSDNDIAAVYETSLMAGDQLAMPVFTSLMEIQRRGDRWAARAAINGMKNIKWPITSPIFVPDKDGKA